VPHVFARGNRTYYEMYGEGPPPPLVLVMGMGGSCRGWHALQVPELSRHRRILIFDNRGVGESEDPGGPFSTADLADDTAGLLDALGIEKADVLGAFMGGMIAQELALRHPERVDRLVLVGTWARADAKRRMLLEKWRDMVKAGLPPEVQVRERLLWTLADETLEQTDLIEAMVRFHLKDRKEHAAVSDDLFVRQCDACLAHDTLTRLAGLAQPTLVVCGQQDQLTPPALHRTLAAAIPDARLVTIPSAAHLVVAEAAQRFHHVVLQFLAENR
jgi:pimeloyl-ACP methyl ester carboxylesterase